ncbi:protein transport protein SEC31-like isoform 1 [Corchorus olitorius]|uniref:Protein transport protein SEC31-like isoform 1 n=1 Tax=Corchorus olitorius TaxID=93759 RepID=A0A1R3K5A6_9ROSI|nr:protein transport protein SEC31-like isoform 1 [Corchorus olitorius]
MDRRKFAQRSKRVKSVDLHLTEPWILASLYSGSVCIWNYQLQVPVAVIVISSFDVIFHRINTILSKNMKGNGNQLPDALSFFDEAFLALTKDNSHGADITAQATICAQYKIAVTLLQNGLAHLEPNQLPDVLSFFDEAFLALAMYNSHGANKTAQATICAQYKIAVTLLQSFSMVACMAPLPLRSLLAGDCEIENDFDVGGDGSLRMLQAAAAANLAQAIVITLLEECDKIFGHLEFGCTCKASHFLPLKASEILEGNTCTHLYIEIWSRFLTTEHDKKSYVDLLQDLMEKTIVLALATDQKPFSASLCKLGEKYTEILAIQGLLTAAMEYLKLLGSDELSPELAILRDELSPELAILKDCIAVSTESGMCLGDE